MGEGLTNGTGHIQILGKNDRQVKPGVVLGGKGHEWTAGGYGRGFAKIPISFFINRAVDSLIRKEPSRMLCESERTYNSMGCYFLDNA